MMIQAINIKKSVSRSFERNRESVISGEILVGRNRVTSKFHVCMLRGVSTISSRSSSWSSTVRSLLFKRYCYQGEKRWATDLNKSHGMHRQWQTSLALLLPRLVFEVAISRLRSREDQLACYEHGYLINKLRNKSLGVVDV